MLPYTLIWSIDFLITVTCLSIRIATPKKALLLNMLYGNHFDNPIWIIYFQLHEKNYLDVSLQPN